MCYICVNYWVMAYTRKYLLERVKEVNEVYVEKHRLGITNEFIYEHHIKDKFHISRTTFYNYLTIPYAKEMKNITE